MKKVTLTIGDYLYEFYSRIGKSAGDISVEQVMADALFKLAGELSLHALDEKRTERKDDTSRS